MLKSLFRLRKIIRKVSSIKTVFSDAQCKQALSWLIETASTKCISPEEFRVLHYERPWATAPVVIAHGKIAESGASANGLIRWLRTPERDVVIEFENYDNMYTVQVKAVYYAILNAMFHRVPNVIIYSPNEIVVKVGSGIFKPKKETKLFEGIRRRTLISEQSWETQVKLCVMSDKALEKLNMTLEDAISRKSVPTYSEDSFRARHSSEIVRI